MRLRIHSLKSLRIYHRIALILLSILLLHAPVRGQLVDWDWAKGIYSDSVEQINDLAVDQSDNSIYVAGVFEGDLSPVYSPGTNPSSDMSFTYGDKDGFVAKYSAEGSFQWAFKVGGENDDVVNAIDIDKQGYIYICGQLGTGTCTVQGTDSADISAVRLNASKRDFYIAKFNSDGEFIWIRYSDSDFGNFIGNDLCLTSDAVYAAGNYDDWGSLGPLNTLNNPNRKDIFLVKYDLDGNEQWIADAGSNGDDYARALVAEDTSVYMLGDYIGSNLNVNHAGGGNALSLGNPSNGSNSIFLIAYDNNGQVNWGETIASSADDNARDLCMHADSLFITGGICNDASFPSYTANPVASSGAKDIFLSAHAKADGSTGWVKVIPSTNAGDQRGRSITCDDSGNLYVLGDFDEDVEFPGPRVLSSLGMEDCFLASYTKEGTFRWAERMGSTTRDDGNALGLGFNGDIFAGGAYTASFDAGPLSLPDSANLNAFLVKLHEAKIPENDNPCSALLIPVNDTCHPLKHSNRYATNSGVPDPACGSYVNNDLWFKTVVPPSGNVFISLKTGEKETYPPEAGNTWKIAMAVYSGSCSSLIEEGCYAGNSAANFRAANVFLQERMPGDTLWIRAWEVGGDENGNFTICAFDPGAFPGWQLADFACDNRDRINLDTTLSSVKKVFGSSLTESGITAADNILGSPDDQGAEFYTIGDWLILDMEDTIPEGEVFSVYFSTNTSTIGISNMKIETSLDDLNYTTLSFRPESEQDNFTNLPIIAEQDFRYLKITNEDSGGGGFLIDAVTSIYGATRGGTWSGPGVSGSIFDPEFLSGSVEITYSVGISSNRKDSTISILLSSAPRANPGESTEVCGLSTRLDASLSEGGTGSWELLSGPGTAAFDPSPVEAGAGISVDAFGSYDLRWTETRDACSDDSTITITFWEVPLLGEKYEEQVCGAAVRLDAGTPNGRGSWLQVSGPGVASFSPENTDANTLVEVDAFGAYLFRWEEINGICAAESNWEVDFVQPLEAYAGEDQVLDNEAQTYLQADDPMRGLGTWVLISGSANIEDANQPYTLVSELQIGVTQFSWTVRAVGDQCPESSDTVNITMQGVKYPTVLTPNNDGQNDRLIFADISDNRPASIQIFNRWGAEVYMSDNYRNDWIGKDKRGRDLIPDTYYYVLIIEGNDPVKGFIEIRR